MRVVGQAAGGLEGTAGSVEPGPGNQFAAAAQSGAGGAQKSDTAPDCLSPPYPIRRSVTLIYLASASPRRRELLRQIGVPYRLLRVEVDETPLKKEIPRDYVARVALAKARTGCEMLGRRRPCPVLGADTAVVVDDVILGKPRNREEGLAMLASLSGRDHRVLSAVALATPTRNAVKVQESRVRFRELQPAECTAYWDTGEPLDKAGGYGIQGGAAAFIAELHGSYSGVMGLPLYETAELLREFGIHFWHSPTS